MRLGQILLIVLVVMIFSSLFHCGGYRGYGYGYGYGFYRPIFVSPDAIAFVFIGILLFCAIFRRR